MLQIMGLRISYSEKLAKFRLFQQPARTDELIEGLHNRATKKGAEAATSRRLVAASSEKKPAGCPKVIWKG
jgi:hypothetical protein